MTLDEINKLDRYLRPHAICTGKVVTRAIVEIIRKWANGEIGWNNKGDKKTFELANQALATRERWFYIEKRKGHSSVKVITPITSIAQAKKLGLKPFKVPEFPKEYNPGDIVGKQQFTYGQLYAAWRGAFEKLISDSSDDYPFVTDLRAAPDYDRWDGVESEPTDVEYIFDSVEGMDQQIDAMCVEFYANDCWNGQADPHDYGFHIEHGIIDEKYVVAEFLPPGSNPVAYKNTKQYRNEVIESADTKLQVENYFRGIYRKVPAIIYRGEGYGTEGIGTTLVFRPKGHPDTLRLRLKENMTWQCDCIDPKDPAKVNTEGPECDSIEEAISDAVDIYEDDIPLEIPGFTKENIAKAKKIVKELTQHLKDCGLKLALDEDDDALFIVPDGTRWGSGKPPKGYVAANGNVLEEMEDKGTLFTQKDLVCIHMCDACGDFDGELFYPDPKKAK